MLKNRIPSVAVQWVFAFVMILSVVSPVSAQEIRLTHSYAESYQMGDVNLDGVINQEDINAIEQHVLGVQILSPEGENRANVNCDRRINMSDVHALQDYFEFGIPLPVC